MIKDLKVQVTYERNKVHDLSKDKQMLNVSVFQLPWKDTSSTQIDQLKEQVRHFMETIEDMRRDHKRLAAT